MKILLIEWASFGNEDIKEAFTLEGHTVACFPLAEAKDSSKDEIIEKELLSALHTDIPDVVFSFNFFPVISNVCQKEGIRYISWIYDSPYVRLYSYTAINPCNIIYIFDKEWYMEFHTGGIPTVHYLPLAANTKRLDAAISASSNSYTFDVSFVGSLYTEKHNFFERMTTLSDYTKGYLDGLMAAQMKVQGYNFIQESLSPIMDDLFQALPMTPSAYGAETKEYLYSQCVINRKITGLERMDLLTAISKQNILDLFTYNKEISMPNLHNHGAIDYYDYMPYVFKQSRINLNITLRSIKSGIPLRAFDIMGCGGFLLSNYQADFLDYFTPGEDFEYFESKEDLLQKIHYYLKHDDERTEIARNGYNKVVSAHTYRHRVREMLSSIVTE